MGGLPLGLPHPPLRQGSEVKRYVVQIEEVTGHYPWAWSVSDADKVLVYGSRGTEHHASIAAGVAMAALIDDNGRQVLVHGLGQPNKPTRKKVAA